MAICYRRNLNGELIPVEVPDWLQDAPQTPLARSLGIRKEYHHHIVCNGDRRWPIGTPGKGCSCLGRTVIWSKSKKRFIRMDECL